VTNLPKSLDPKTLAVLDGLSLRSRQIVEGLLAGSHRSPFRGVSVEFAEHREYVPGDDLRHVDWKVYGRTDKLYLKQFVDEANMHCSVLVDSSASMNYGAEGTLNKYEYAQCIAIALSWLVLRNGDAAGAGHGNTKLQGWLPSSTHPDQLERLIELLQAVPSSLRSSGDFSFKNVLTETAERLSQRSVVYVISDFLMELPPVFQGIERLRVEGHDVTLIHILDRDELDFPFDGVLQLNGLEDNQKVRVEAEVIADRYKTLISQYCQEFEARSRNLGADYELFVTDVNLQTALLAYFQRIQSRRRS
jgi:uncharacterized protein (DUF58 family)|tara:strand:+ start:318 stop:1232 length:915 start_codon:yes stop_codon:yes gene_type:complete